MNYTEFILKKCNKNQDSNPRNSSAVKYHTYSLNTRKSGYSVMDFNSHQEHVESTMKIQKCAVSLLSLKILIIKIGGVVS